MQRFLLWMIFPLLLWSQSAWSQAGADKSEFGWEFQPHLGNILPNQVENVEEIVPMWGLRATMPTNSKGLTYEFGATVGRGEGVEWENAHISVRLEENIEEILGIFYVGIDGHSYLGKEQEEREQYGGGHLGGGFMAQVRGPLWFRGDMKFNVNPGTSLYFGFGFSYRFPPSEKKEGGAEK